jgi:hypothetical protein
MKIEAVRQTKVVAEIICDICGDSVVPDEQKQFLENLNGFASYGQLKGEFGFGSPNDGEKYCFDLCEACFLKLASVAEQMKTTQQSGGA